MSLLLASLLTLLAQPYHPDCMTNMEEIKEELKQQTMTEEEAIQGHLMCLAYYSDNPLTLM